MRSGSPSRCTPAPEMTDPPEVPADLPWPDGLTLTDVQARKKFVTVDGFRKATVEELFDETQAQVVAHDFDVINVDFEGFEAEVYFARATSIAGIARLREGPCDGYVSVSVLYDPLETRRGRDAVEKTRDLIEGD